MSLKKPFISASLALPAFLSRFGGRLAVWSLRLAFSMRSGAAGFLPGRLSCEQAFQRLEEHLRLHGLGEVGVEASLHAALHVLAEGVGRERDDGNAACVGALQRHGPDGARSLEAAHLGHAHVHENGVVVAGLVPLEHVDGDAAVRGVVGLDAAHGEHHEQNFRVDVHVLGDEHAPALEARRLGGQDRVLRPEGLLELFHDGAGEEGFGHEAVDARGPGIVGDVFPVEGGQDDDGRAAADDGADVLRGLHAVHAVHAQIDQHEIVVLLAGVAHPDLVEALLARCGRLADDANVAEHDLRVLQGNGGVVDHEHAHVAGNEVARQRVGAPAAGHAERHRDGDGRAPSLFAVHLDVAVHELDDALGDGHAEAGAAVLVDGRGILLAEGVEEMRQEVFAHADAGVADHEPERCPAFVPESWILATNQAPT